MREKEKGMRVIFIVISCGGFWVNSYSDCGKQEVKGISLALFSGFKKTQLFIDAKELSVIKVKITSLQCDAES